MPTSQIPDLENKHFRFRMNIIAGQPTANGRVYPREVLEKAVESFNESGKTIPIISDAVKPNLKDMVGEVSRLYFTEDGSIEADCVILSGFGEADVCKSMLNSGLVYLMPNGTGMVDVLSGIVSDYNFESVSVCRVLDSGVGCRPGAIRGDRLQGRFLARRCAGADFAGYDYGEHYDNARWRCLPCWRWWRCGCGILVIRS